MKQLLIIAVLFLSGCSYSIKEIDVSKADKNCVRQCAASYSKCIQGGPVIGSQMEILRACRESYSICIDTCPVKK